MTTTTVATNEKAKTKAPKKRAANDSPKVWRSIQAMQRNFAHRRLRRLGAAGATANKENRRADRAQRAAARGGQMPNNQERPNRGILVWSMLWLLIASGGLVLGGLVDLSGAADTISDFIDSYTNQYNVIVQERPGYCERHARLGAMVDHAWDQVLNQPDALERLELALDNTTFNVSML